METTQDKVLAVVFALVLHAGVIGMLFVTLLWPQPPPVPDDEGPAIEATLVSAPQQSTAAAKAIQAAEQKVVQPPVSVPPPQPTPEPKPQDAPQPQQLAPQVQLPKPDTVNQDEVRREADLAAMQKARQEQEERRKQEQVDLTKQLQQQQDAENRQRLAQQQLEQQQKIAKELAAAARDVKLKEEAMKQLQDQAARVAQNGAQPVAAARPVPPQVSPGVTTWSTKQKLAVGYMQAIREVANANWHHDNVPEKVHCHVELKQLVGGEVVNVKFVDCPLDATGQASVEAALERTPLPYAGFESVFQPVVNIDMCYPEEACK